PGVLQTLGRSPLSAHSNKGRSVPRETRRSSARDSNGTQVSGRTNIRALHTPWVVGRAFGRRRTTRPPMAGDRSPSPPTSIAGESSPHRPIAAPHLVRGGGATLPAGHAKQDLGRFHVKPRPRSLQTCACSSSPRTGVSTRQRPLKATDLTASTPSRP